MNQLGVLDLFSGIGGFTRGLEPVGLFHTMTFCEINPFCQKVLRKHWPDVSLIPDIRSLKVLRGSYDVLTGGFPCQNVSTASSIHSEMSSILGNQSGLWWQYLRLIDECRPTWILIENVDNLRRQGLSIILQQLADLGYDAEWNVIRAADVGFPHRRKRVWVVAHANSQRLEGNSPFPLRWLRSVLWRENLRSFETFRVRSVLPEPLLVRSLAGIPNGVDRIKALGNSIVPHIAYHLGMAIRTYYEENGVL